MTEPVEGSAPVAIDPEPVAPALTLPPISGFWRRFFAFAIDGFVLGLAGQLMVAVFSPFWYEIGPYGRLAGLFMGLAYFGLLNSRLGGGRTLGKSLLGIAVVDGAGQRIGVGRSILRTLIVLIPATLNGWALPIFATQFGGWFISVIFFGVGGALLFTMIFNQRTRQGLHDMLCGTYVARINSERIAAFPTVARSQWIATAVIVGLAVMLPFVAMKIVQGVGGDRLAPMMSLHKTLARDPRFFSASVMDQSFSSSDGKTIRSLQITVWQKGYPLEDVRDQTSRDIAKQALASVPGVDHFDNMLVSIRSGYDLGIASAYSTYNAQQSIPVWRQKVGSGVVRGPAQ